MEEEKIKKEAECILRETRLKCTTEIAKDGPLTYLEKASEEALCKIAFSDVEDRIRLVAFRLYLEKNPKKAENLLGQISFLKKEERLIAVDVLREKQKRPKSN